MKFLSEVDNSKEIKKLLECGKPIKCAVAFWGETAWNLFENSKATIQIICNLDSGATNPYLIKRLQEKSNITIKSNSKIHSKVYLVPGNKAIVGSSNISANGLSFEDGEVSGWIEASILIENDNGRVLGEISNWFDTKWQAEASKDVTDDILEIARKKWKRRRHVRNFETDNTNSSLLTELKINPHKFKDRSICFAIYRKHGTLEGRDKFQEVKEQLRLPQRIDYWEGWSELLEDAVHISLYFGPRGGFSYDGIWQTPSPKLVEEFTYNNGEPGEISICFHVDSIMGLEITPADEKILKKNISKLWKSQNPEDKKEAVLISLYEARKILFNKNDL